MTRWGFCGGSYVDTSPTVAVDACENWLPEVVATPTAKARVVLKARPGLTRFATAGAGPHRAALWENGRAFVLSGDTLYELFTDGTATSRGRVAYRTGEPGTLHGNGTGGGQLLIISGGRGYILTLATNALAPIVDAGFPADVVQGFYLNGHFGVIARASRTFAISAPFDGTAWAALDISEKSKTTDNLVGCLVDQDASELWLIGHQRTEVWWYSGAAGFPLEPVPNLIVPTGGAAGYAWIPVGGAVYGLGQSVEGGVRVVRMQAGYTPERLSTHPIEAAIQSYSTADVAAATACALDWQGHRIYALTIPNQATWIYDETTGFWSRWTYWNTATATAEPFLGATHMFAFGTHLLGSRADGSVYQLSETAYDDAGDAIRCVRRSPYLSDGPHRLVHTRLWFDMHTGVGLTTGQGRAPVGLVRSSDDGGQTWSPTRDVDLGAIGRFRTQATLRRLGLAGVGGRVYELVITDPVVRAIVDADVEVAPDVDRRAGVA